MRRAYWSRAPQCLNLRDSLAEALQIRIHSLDIDPYIV
jgi:hypothetical protein